MRSITRKYEDARRLRLKAQEMLRLAQQATLPDVAAELTQMAALLHQHAVAVENSAEDQNDQKVDEA